MAPLRTKILIIGAGPTGLGAACRLTQHGNSDWMLVEAGDKAGGLAGTDTTDEGFLFDLGGHVIFSHFKYFDDILNAALGADGWNQHQRVSYVRIKDRYVAYPFQNNISALDKDDQLACLKGLIDARVAYAGSQTRPKTFHEWIMRNHGEGIAQLFMTPYNFKVWAFPTTEMQCDWLGERVALVDINRVLANVLHGREDAGWGPNATFRFPKKGGTGAIWKAVADKLLPQENLRFNSRVTKLDVANRTATLENGDSICYEKLLSTMPLQYTLEFAGRSDLSTRLKYSSTHVVGFGVRGISPHELKCWLYYPESNCPFYRATIFSHYSDDNCPDASAELPTLKLGDGSDPSDKSPRKGPYWSVMLEISESKEHKPVDHSTIVVECLQGCVNAALLRPEDEVVSIYHRCLPLGYPTPHTDRDAVLDEALPWLKQRDVWSRGRFGSYKYEVGNQDHSLMLGVEAVDNMLFGTAELTVTLPSVVNEMRRHKSDIRWSSTAGGDGQK